MSNSVNPVKMTVMKSRLHRIYMIIRIDMIFRAKLLHSNSAVNAQTLFGLDANGASCPQALACFRLTSASC